MITAQRWTAIRAGQKQALLLATVLACALVPATAVLAGAKISEVVSINTTTRTASGSLGSTRATSNSIDYIGCWSRINADSSYSGGCDAQQRVSLFTTRTISCTFPPDPSSTGFVWSLRAITPDAHIQFTWVNIGGVSYCETLKVTSSAHNRPKTL